MFGWTGQENLYLPQEGLEKVGGQSGKSLDFPHLVGGGEKISVPGEELGVYVLSTSGFLQPFSPLSVCAF